jgi:hypothetical protein
MPFSSHPKHPPWDQNNGSTLEDRTHSKASVKHNFKLTYKADFPIGSGQITKVNRPFLG